MLLLQGTVQKGAQRGKALGFPTANIALDIDVPEGIYVSNVLLEDASYNALTFIGKALTFGATKVFAESYLLDFSGDIYGKAITIQLLGKIRDNKKFDSPKDLIQQMHNDVRAAREYFKEN